MPFATRVSLLNFKCHNSLVKSHLKAILITYLTLYQKLLTLHFSLYLYLLMPLPSCLSPSFKSPCPIMTSLVNSFTFHFVFISVFISTPRSQSQPSDDCHGPSSSLQLLFPFSSFYSAGQINFPGLQFSSCYLLSQNYTFDYFYVMTSKFLSQSQKALGNFNSI